MKVEIELWSDMNDVIKVNVIVINGKLKPEVKIFSAERLTQAFDDLVELINNNRIFRQYY